MDQLHHRGAFDAQALRRVDRSPGLPRQRPLCDDSGRRGLGQRSAASADENTAAGAELRKESRTLDEIVGELTTLVNG